MRLATHASFRELVEGAGLEFYPLGGDPQQLSSYMVCLALFWVQTMESRKWTFRITVDAVPAPHDLCDCTLRSTHDSTGHHACVSTMHKGCAVYAVIDRACLRGRQVENRGIVPGPKQLPQIPGQRRQLREVIWSCWPACSAPSPHTPDVPFTVTAASTG